MSKLLFSPPETTVFATTRSGPVRGWFQVGRYLYYGSHFSNLPSTKLKINICIGGNSFDNKDMFIHSTLIRVIVHCTLIQLLFVFILQILSADLHWFMFILRARFKGKSFSL